MATSDSVRLWVKALRPSFPWFEQGEAAASTWLNSAAMPLRPDVWQEPVREASLDPRRRDDLRDRWLAGIAAHLNVPPPSLFPTMGTHMTIERVLALLDVRGPGRYLVAPDAHAAVMNGLELLYAKGRAEIVPIRLDEIGRVDLGWLTENLTAKVRGVILTHVSSVTGTRQEVRAVAAIVRDARETNGASTLLVVDGAQAVPRLPVDASEADVYVLSAHKVGGFPGAVVALSDVGLLTLAPYAGDLEQAHGDVLNYLAGGTVHVESLGALAASLAFLDGLPQLDDHTPAGMRSVAAAMGLLRDRLFGRLHEIDGVEPHFAPDDPDENAGIVSFSVTGKTPAEVGAALEERGVHVRAATRDDRGHFYHVPLATVFLPWLEERGGALRASPWITSVPEDVDRLGEALREILGG